MESCDGPLSFDEGSDWVQLNWVCRVDDARRWLAITPFKMVPKL